MCRTVKIGLPNNPEHFSLSLILALFFATCCFSVFVVVKICLLCIYFQAMRALFLGILISLTALVLLLYKPLPKGFCLTARDRFLMHLFETTLRIAYLYPVCVYLFVFYFQFWDSLYVSSNINGYVDACCSEQYATTAWSSLHFCPPWNYYNGWVMERSAGSSYTFIVIQRNLGENLQTNR